jgi:hypothetical protein
MVDLNNFFLRGEIEDKSNYSFEKSCDLNVFMFCFTKKNTAENK